MSNADFLFLMEFLCGEIERTFLKKIHDNPRDWCLREAYANWLESQARPQGAAKIRHGYIPGMGYIQTEPIRTSLLPWRKDT